MSPEEREELAIAYLLNELSDSERSEFEARMAGDAELARLVEDLENSMGLAALADTELVEPALELKDRILAAAEVVPESGASEVKSESKMAVFPMLVGVIGWAAALAVAFIYFQEKAQTERLDLALSESLAEISLLESRSRQLAQESSVLRERTEELSEQLNTAIAATAEIRAEFTQVSEQLAETNLELEQTQLLVAQLRERSALDKMQIAGLRSEIDQLQYGITVWDTEQDSGVVKVFNLPELDTPTQDYQLWVISVDDPAPISAGVFQVDGQGNAEYRFDPDRPVSAVKAFAISREKKGGSVAPEGQIMLSGAL